MNNDLSQNLIRSPDDPQLGELCELLRSKAEALETTHHDSAWPQEQLQLTHQYGVDQWFIPAELGGLGWSGRDIVEGYLMLSAACLTTTFVITQRAAAIRRIVASENESLRNRLIPEIISGQSAATVGISHLTTSRRHLGRPVLTAMETESGFLLNGFSPWVTGACGASYVVIGAELPDGREVLLALPTDAPGVSVEPGFRLVALSASQTGAVRCSDVEVQRKWLLSGPVNDVLTSGNVSATGGYQTSALAAGLAGAAIEFIGKESGQRTELLETHRSLHDQLQALTDNLLLLASGNPVCSTEQLRFDANSLVLRATQAALVAAKGTGFVVGHPVGRWCREALFFLVWSCPQAVANANLCELAGIESEF